MDNSNEMQGQLEPKPKRKHDIYMLNQGDNAVYTQFNIELAGLEKINIRDPKQMQDRLQKYFQMCADRDRKPSVAGLALALGINRSSLRTLAAGRKHYYGDALPPKCVDLLKQAYAIINSVMEDFMLDGKINPVSGIFLMTNNLGYQQHAEGEMFTEEERHEDVATLLAEAEMLTELEDGGENVHELEDNIQDTEQSTPPTP